MCCQYFCYFYNYLKVYENEWEKIMYFINDIKWHGQSKVYGYVVFMNHIVTWYKAYKAFSWLFICFLF